MGKKPVLAGFDSPFGRLAVTLDGDTVTALRWGDASASDLPLAQEVARQLAEYFSKSRKTFDLPLAPRASEFQARFYAALCAIPYGETRTYGELSRELGVSAQAVGQACGGNLIPILIPCHRVLGVNSLGGFSGGAGVETKVALLRHEGAAGLLI